MARRISRKSSFLFLSAAALLLGACHSDNIQPGESIYAIRNNPAPGLANEDMRDADINNQISETWNDNNRKDISDWGRFWLLDRPNRLTPYPTPY